MYPYWDFLYLAHKKKKGRNYKINLSIYKNKMVLNGAFLNTSNNLSENYVEKKILYEYVALKNVV